MSSQASPPRPVYVSVIGVGGVGSAFLTQLEALAHRYSSTPSAPCQIHLVHVSRSSTCILGEFNSPIPFESWKDALSVSKQEALKLPALAEFLAKAPGNGHAVVVDNTSNQDVAHAYPSFLEKGISVVTPNKKAFSSDIGLWDSIFGAASNSTKTKNPKGGLVFHESSVGAGLPVISTLNELLETGDMVTKIEGVFSGTMSFLFNAFMPVGGGGGSFSAEVSKAKELGYTEPDPRDDLNGLDVARKLTILARLAGLQVESPTSFPVQSLIPDELSNVKSADEFMSRLPEFDDVIEKVKQEAANEGKVLRFVGSVDMAKQEVEVGLRKFDPSHPIAALKGSDNIISFSTKRYLNSPLVIQGAGAGGDLTAMGVLADLIKVCKMAR